MKSLIRTSLYHESLFIRTKIKFARRANFFSKVYDILREILETKREARREPFIRAREARREPQIKANG